MKVEPTLTNPLDSGTFFRVYIESPECGCRTFYVNPPMQRMLWKLLCKLSVSARGAPPCECKQQAGGLSLTRQNGTFCRTERERGNPERLEKIVRYLEANFDRKIRLEDVAGHVGMSRKGLSRFCSRYLPGGFSAFLIALRLERAADLLLSTSDTILYIALSCGFESISHFNEQFRKHFGMNPSEKRIEN